MEFLNITSDWVQVGELGLAFIVVILSSALVLFVIKTSARREHDYLVIITKVLPVMENMAASISGINLRLESIEDNQMLLYAHKKPNKLPRKKAGNTVPVPTAAEVLAVVNEVKDVKVD